MKLYYVPISPYSQKVLIALDEKGTQHTAEMVNLRDAAARAAYEQLNRFGKVPFLVDEKREAKVAESSIIIEYLEEHAKGGTQLIPSDPDGARQARFYDRVFDLYVAEQALKIFVDGRRPEDKRDALGVEAAQKRLDKTYGMLDDELAKRTWVLGDAFTIADISAAAALGIANMVRPFGAHKNLMAYFGRLTERPSVQRAFKQVQELMARG